MNRLCLDTSAYSNFQRGDPRVAERLDRAHWVGVPTVVLGELQAGFLLGDRVERNAAQLDEFLAHPAVETLVADADVAYIYGEIFADLRARGRPLPTNDLWIAATAVQAGATLLTFDDRFRVISRVSSIVLQRSDSLP